MPNVKFQIGMDNRIKPGQTTRNEIIAALQAQGIAVSAADPVFDPITGELVRVDVNLPDTASQQAVDAIAANPGVAVTTPPIPEPLFVYDLTDIALTNVTGMKDGAAGEQSDMMVVAFGRPDGVGGTVYGGVIRGAGAVYADGLENTDGLSATILQVVNHLNASDADIVVPDAGIQLAIDGGTKDLTHSPITVGQGTAPFVSTHHFWIDSTGKLYYRERFGDPNLPNIFLRSFDEAITFGPV